VTAGENVVRLVPPLVITEADIAEAVAMMRRGAARCLVQASRETAT
jgi:acetylornithine/succinyldiaminopimelate/putrescine aminotransferase